jgi:membrane protein required for colicin V production
MNWLDYLLIVILGFSALQSFRRGFTREIISLIATIAALVLAMWFYGRAASWVKPWIASDRGADFAGFLIVVLGVLAAGAIVGFIVSKFVRAVGLSFFDRLLGAGFGLLRGSLIAIALLTAYVAFGPRSGSATVPSAVLNSQIAPYLLKASSVLVDAAPAELERSFREVYDEAHTEIKNIASPGDQGAVNKDAGKK